MKKKTSAQLKKILWQLCRQVAFTLYPTNCYTCEVRNLQGANCQLGHLWSKASLSAHLKYDMRVLRWQCFRCNINFGGQGAIFYARMLKEIGKKKMDALVSEKQILVKADAIFFEKKIEEYAKKLKELKD